ncbi:MAG TPA: DUF488 domain-containing protein [Flavisolibacter sp.]
MEKQVWTIGHSTRSIEDFLALLQSFQIQMVVDVRHYPGSKRYPHFNKEDLERELVKNQIGYLHLVDLGGRRSPLPDSINTAWRHKAFRGYADYMQTGAFKLALAQLEDVANRQPTAYMCSEAVWWSCHRSLISDVLKANGWKVMHIMSMDKATEHPYTKPAKVVNGEVVYRD